MKETLNGDNRLLLTKAAIMALKIGMGSAFAIVVAVLFNLNNPTAAGTITLLTLMNTKVGTLKLIIRRLISFLITVACCLAIFSVHDTYWMYGMFLVIIVFVTELLGWTNTLSVNALIGMHFLHEPVLTFDFIVNEFYLLLIGIVIAFVLNFYYGESHFKHHIYRGMVRTEKDMQGLLAALVGYLRDPDADDPFPHIARLEANLKDCQKVAEELFDNTFSNDPLCFIKYFQMRMRQYQILLNLQDEIKILKTRPRQAAILADFMESLIPHIRDHHIPYQEMRELNNLVEHLTPEGPMENPHAFQDYAVLYHIFMDLKDFIRLKMDFIEDLDLGQGRVYFAESAYAKKYEEKALRKKK